MENVDTFTLNGDGETLLAPLYVDDVVKSLCSAISTHAHNNIVDLCSDKPLSLQSLVEQVSSALGRKVHLSYQPTKEESIRFWSSNDQARQLFVLDTPLPLAEGVLRYRNWICSSVAAS